MAPTQVPLGLPLFPTKSCLRAGVVGAGHSVKKKHSIESCANTQNLTSLVYLHLHSIHVPPTRFTQFSRM